MDTISGLGRRLSIPRTGRRVRLCEPLENRVLLHAAIHHALPPDLAALANDDGHELASEFLEARPQFAGKDLWNPTTFNPSGSLDRNDWLYDPHFIEDDITQYDFPQGGNTPDGGGSLPDIYPLGQNQGFLVPFLDTTEIPGHNLLRFSTAVGNMGQGPINLFSANSGTPPAGSGLTSWINPDGTQNVVQGIYQFNAATQSFTFDHYRAAGRMAWHNGHGHFHFEGYAAYKLRHNNGGQPGATVIRNDGNEAVGDKIGFCLINIFSSFQLPNGQSSQTLPGYGRPGQPGNGCGFQQGIHVGFADVYDAIYDGQWIDVTGVPNGNYFLEVTLDASNLVQESDETNNVQIVPVTLNANPPAGNILPDRFEPNNTQAVATNLGVLGHQTQSGLTIHFTDEPDWFRFTAASSGSGQVRVTIGDGRDVNLFLYDDAGTLLRSSTSASSPTETVTWDFVEGRTYYAVAKGFGTAQGTSGVSSNYSIQWLINPTVNATAPDPTANELGGNSGIIALGRNGPVSSPLTVNFTVAGTATRGTDYEIYHEGVLVSGDSVTIGNATSSAQLEVRPIHEGTPEAPETVVITLGASSAYAVGANASATVTIGDSGPELTNTTQVWQTSPHQLIMTIARAVASTISAADFTFQNLDNSQTVTPTSVIAAQNGDNATVTVTFNGVLPDGRYRATMLGGGIQNQLGEPGGSNFDYNFFVLTGDANHDGRVNLDDFNVLAAHFGQTGQNASTGDFTYDGIVNLDDFNVLASKFGTVIAGASGDGSSGALPPLGGGTVRGGGSPFGDGKSIGDDDEGGPLDELT